MVVVSVVREARVRLPVTRETSERKVDRET